MHHLREAKKKLKAREGINGKKREPFLRCSEERGNAANAGGVRQSIMELLRGKEREALEEERRKGGHRERDPDQPAMETFRGMTGTSLI